MIPGPTTNRMQVISSSVSRKKKKNNTISIRLVTNGGHMCGICWFLKDFFILGYFGTDERLAIKRGDRVAGQIGQPRGLTQSAGPSRPLRNVMF